MNSAASVPGSGRPGRRGSSGASMCSASKRSPARTGHHFVAVQFLIVGRERRVDGDPGLGPLATQRARMAAICAAQSLRLRLWHEPVRTNLNPAGEFSRVGFMPQAFPHGPIYASYHGEAKMKRGKATRGRKSRMAESWPEGALECASHACAFLPTSHARRRRATGRPRIRPLLSSSVRAVEWPEARLPDRRRKHGLRTPRQMQPPANSS
jgi:hypothetical protein